MNSRPSDSQIRDSIAGYAPYGLKYESPIEKLLAGAIHLHAGIFAMEHATQDLFCELRSQVDISGYRVDLMLIGTHCAVAIECDGHDFHEKTKKQASRDKARDRAITAAGYSVMRFTGSEIWRDPFACAGEAIAHAYGQTGDALALTAGL